MLKSELYSLTYEILFITNTFPSRERKHRGLFNLRAVRALAKRHIVTVVHLRSWSPGRRIIEEALLEGKMRLITISIPILPKVKPWFWAWQLLIYKRLVFSILKRVGVQYNIIHSVGMSFSGIVGSYISQNTGVKHVAQCIGSDVNITLPKIRFYNGVKGFELFVNRFVCNSVMLKTNLEKIFPFVQADVVYRGVDLKEFPYHPSKKAEPIFTYFYLGGLSERKSTGYGRNYKGGVTLLNAWKLVNSLCDKKALEIQLIFGGPDVSMEVINSIFPKGNEISNLQIVGELSSQEVAQHMAKANVVIIPSHMEGFPNVAFEAMASGCSLIVSKVGGIPEIVKKNVNGIYVEPGNEEMLAQAIYQMALDPETYRRMGVVNRQTIEERYSLDRFVEVYSKIYSDAK